MGAATIATDKAVREGFRPIHHRSCSTTLDKTVAHLISPLRRQPEEPLHSSQHHHSAASKAPTDPQPHHHGKVGLETSAKERRGTPARQQHLSSAPAVRAQHTPSPPASGLPRPRSSKAGGSRPLPPVAVPASPATSRCHLRPLATSRQPRPPPAMAAGYGRQPRAQEASRPPTRQGPTPAGQPRPGASARRQHRDQALPASATTFAAHPARWGH
jgi:hypothetical protein